MKGPTVVNLGMWVFQRTILPAPARRTRAGIIPADQSRACLGRRRGE